MQAYVDQLLEAIADGHCNEEEMYPEVQALPGPEKAAAMFADVEHYLHRKPRHPLSYYCGLQEEMFPPAERLNDKQVAAIIRTYNEMLFSWNIAADMPKKLPARVVYRLLISLLNEYFIMDKYGLNTWSFCESDQETCAYGEHCSCRGR